MARPMSNWASVLAGLGAATSFACAAILQQEAARSVPNGDSFRLLMHQPKWLAGISMLLAAYGEGCHLTIGHPP
jgi:hypothetical protein